MSDCWMWKARRNHKGYGISYTDVPPGKSMALAHRQVYEVLVGPIPDGLTLDHSCENPGCVNPEHLTPMTMDSNYRKGPWTSPNRTHCPQGHEYTPENTKRVPSRPNTRYCRTCNRKSAHAKRDRAVPAERRHADRRA